MFFRTSAPPKERQDAALGVSRVESFYRNQALKMGSRKKEDLERKVRRIMDEWKDRWGPVQEESRELNKLLEGKTDDTDFPFREYSSQIDVRFAAGQFRTLKANFRRTVFNTPRLYVAKLGPGAKRADMNQLEEAVNWTAEEETNLNETLEDTILPIYRDGTAWVYGEWVREIERGVDYKVYSNQEEFLADFPTPREAGLSESRYQDALAEVNRPGGELQIEFDLKFVSKDQPEYSMIPMAHFIMAPTYAKKMADLAVYGFKFVEPGDRFRERVKHGFYDKEAADAVKRRSSYGYEKDSWTAAQDEIEGIDGANDDAVTYNMAKLILKADLDNDGIVECYRVWWEMDRNRALRIERYSVRRNTPSVVPFKFAGRDNRIPGVSLLRDGRDLFEEINAIHRHRSNTRRLTDAPVVMFPEGMKEEMDFGAEEQIWSPGKPLYVPDRFWKSGQLPTQLGLTNLDRSGGSVDEENLVVRYLEILLGPTQGQSGQESQADPRAPGNKTAMLLNAAGVKIGDYIWEWKRSVLDMIRLHLALYFQNHRGDIQYFTFGSDNLKELPLQKLVNPNLRFALKATNLSITPEQEMAAIQAIAQSVSLFIVPLRLKPDILVTMWNDFIAASRMSNAEKYMIPEPGQPEGDAMGQQLQTLLAGGSPAGEGKSLPPQIEAIMGAMGKNNNGAIPQ